MELHSPARVGRASRLVWSQLVRLRHEVQLLTMMRAAEERFASSILPHLPRVRAAAAAAELGDGAAAARADAHALRLHRGAHAFVAHHARHLLTLSQRQVGSSAART